MYLLVIVTLVIGLLSIYAQVLSLQAARLASTQTGLAQAMMSWHYAAVSLGAKIVDNNLLPNGSACSLTVTLPTGLAACPVPPLASAGTVTDAAGTVTTLNTTTGEPVHLPTGYNATLYQFYSVLYRESVTNQPYVVTFVPQPAPNPAPGFLSLPSLPSARETSFTMSDLMHQLGLLNLQPYQWGGIQNPASPTLVTAVAQYPMPTGPTAGSAAVISSTSGL